LVLVAWSLAGDRPAAAHDLGVARVELREEGSGRYEMDVAVHAGPELVSQSPQLPARCTLAGTPSVFRRPGVAVLHFTFTCAGRPLGRGDVLRLPWKREGAFVAVRWRDGTSRSRFFGADPRPPGEGGILVALDELQNQPLGPADVARRYFLLGVEHILTGWDHLAFVFCLCLLARGWRLLKLVTGFTLGHSLSLALAAFDVVRLPSPPTEACIALSIAFVAREALLPPGSRRHGMGLVLTFGLLHGLGFAGALKEVGIGPAELLLGLATFNLGVEAGQLLFVACVLTFLVVGNRLATVHGQSLNVAGTRRVPSVCAGGEIGRHTACAYYIPDRGRLGRASYAVLGRSLSASAVGMVAVFWTLQRIDLFSPPAAALSVPVLLIVLVVHCFTAEAPSWGASCISPPGKAQCELAPWGPKRVQFLASATDPGHAGSSRGG
jgi:hydrogenase/urease accessory protein HupE